MAMANNGHNGVQAEKNAFSMTEPDSMAHLQKKPEKVSLLPEKPKEAVSVKKMETSLPKEKGKTSSMSFNFLYYLFYKFSVTEFFQTPDYNSGGSTIQINLF